METTMMTNEERARVLREMAYIEDSAKEAFLDIGRLFVMGHLVQRSDAMPTIIVKARGEDDADGKDALVRVMRKFAADGDILMSVVISEIWYATFQKDIADLTPAERTDRKEALLLLFETLDPELDALVMIDIERAADGAVSFGRRSQTAGRYFQGRFSGIMPQRAS